MTRNLLLAAALLAAAPATAEPSQREATMIATVDAEQVRHLALLQRLVDTNSGSFHVAGVRKVADLLIPEFAALGFDARFVPLPQTGRAGHLIARHKGDGRGKRLLLIGHLDTVFEPASPFQAWRREGDWGRGPGASDDKGGDIVILAALRAMKAAGTLRQADIMVVLTGDEEDRGTPADLARRDLIEAGRWADVALDFEELSVEDGRDMGVVARRGAMKWDVTASARPAHSAGVFSNGVGYGAIYELARIIDAFRTELTDDRLTYNVGLVAGGQAVALSDEGIRAEVSGKDNIVAATATASGDLRALTPEQLIRTQDKMRAIVARSLPGTSAPIAFAASGYPPMPPTAGNRALLAALNRVNADLGLPPQGELDPVKRGAGDISFVAADVDGLVGLGPQGDGAHTVEERVFIPSIWKQAKRAALLMSRLAADRR